MTFKQYLKRYVNKNSILGDFASDFFRDANAPDNFEDFEQLHKYMWSITQFPCKEATQAAKLLYKRYTKLASHQVASN